MGVGGEEFESFHAHDRIAFAVEARTPCGHGITARVYSPDAASDTAFAGKTDKIGILARIVVKTTCLHDGIDALHLRIAQSYVTIYKLLVSVSKRKKCP